MVSGKYFNRGVMALDKPHIGHVMKETDKNIVVFGDHNFRYDIPKSKVIAVGRNVILDMDFPEIFNYKVDREATTTNRRGSRDISR
jgi:hypothetical protein